MPSSGGCGGAHAGTPGPEGQPVGGGEGERSRDPDAGATGAIPRSNVEVWA